MNINKMENQGNIAAHKENENYLPTKFKCMEYYNLSDKTLKTAVIKKPSKLQGKRIQWNQK